MKKNKLNEEKIESIVNNVIKEFVENNDTNLTEETPSQKKRSIKNVEQFFKNGKSGYNGIQTIVVFTSDNPDSKQQTTQSNKKARRSLLSDIKRGGYAYVPAVGKFGNNENSYAIFNMSIDTAMLLCGKYQQTSFVYSELNDDGSIHSEYFEKLDTTLPFDKDTNNYVRKDECDNWDDMSDADDYFTIIGNKFKYSIPFPMFNTVNETICRNLSKAVAIERERGNKTINESKLLGYTINNVGQSPYLWRKAITKGL